MSRIMKAKELRFCEDQDNQKEAKRFYGKNIFHHTKQIQTNLKLHTIFLRLAFGQK